MSNFLFAHMYSGKESRLLHMTQSNAAETGNTPDEKREAPEKQDPVTGSKERAERLDAKTSATDKQLPAEKAAAVKKQSLEDAGVIPKTDKKEKKDSGKPGEVNEANEGAEAILKAKQLNDKIQELRGAIDPALVQENLPLRCLLSCSFEARSGKIINIFPAGPDMDQMTKIFFPQGNKKIVKVDDTYEEVFPMNRTEIVLGQLDMIKLALGKDLPPETAGQIAQFNEGLAIVETWNFKDHPRLSPALDTMQKEMSEEEKKTPFGKYIKSLKIGENTNGDMILESSNPAAFRAFQKGGMKYGEESYRFRFTFPDSKPQVTPNGYRITIPKADAQSGEYTLMRDIKMYQERIKNGKGKKDQPEEKASKKAE